MKKPKNEKSSVKKRSRILYFFVCLSVSVVASMLGCTPAIRESSGPQVASSSVTTNKDCDVYVLQEGRHSKPQGIKVGTIHIGDTGFTLFGCDASSVLKKIKERACLAGANLIYITEWKEPDFWSTCYRAKADFYGLQIPDWPRLDITRDDLLAEIDSRKRSGNLSAIEGIWVDSDGDYEIAIVADKENADRDFVAVVLEANSQPWWKPMEVKAEIDRTAYPNIYSIKYFLGDRSSDTTTGLIEENGLLKIPLEDPSTGRGIDTLWIKKYPELRAANDSSGPVFSGTCFAVRPDGYLLTNHHVVENRSQLRIIFPNGESTSAEVVKTDVANDIALLKVKRPTPNFLVLGRASSARLGDKVFTIGYPVTDMLGTQPKFSDGAISALSGVGGAANLLQVSVPIQPGNSGGPLVDERGNVVGIITSTAAIGTFLKETGTLPQNVNWAVKAEYAQLLFDAPATNSGESGERQVIAHVEKSICRVEAM
ncbi:MAG: serine protease [Gammaproteobacteria bacterium]|nr:MAG: serine protease [Gammaproteobacteria bacterium]